MKKLSLLSLALTVVMGAAFAAPVDVNQAKNLGLKYVQQTLGVKSAELSLAYTETCASGMDALYVFNYDNGYVVVAADDRAYPILGYGVGAAFDVNNVPEGMRYYLGHYASQIQYAMDENLSADPEVAEQWYLLNKEGVIMKTRSNRGVSPLLSTVWNQDDPYNYYAPAASSTWPPAPGGRCYAGCVATAMSQLMRYWNWPETGVGEHSYTTRTYGYTLSANFGEATYDWANMPSSISNSSPIVKIQAIALLMYHCGIAVDMDYDPEGSGAYTADVPDAISTYFRYGTCANMKSRDDYSKTAWEDMLIASFDRGIPVIYSGSDNSGGHAFNCDGYNDQRMFHFNWGWSGSYNNTYYQIDALNTGNGTFNQNQRVVFDILPDYVYDAMVPAIETLDATVADASTHNVTVSWTVPTVGESGAQLQSITEIILKRDGNVIQTYSNPQPGEVIVFEDIVDHDGCYEYSISGFNNNIEGNSFRKIVLVGPNCTWKLTGQTNNFQGWNGGKIQVVDHNGVVFKEITMNSATPILEKFQMPEGEFQMNWVAPFTAVSSLTIILKNSANQVAYSFNGSSTQLNGTLYSENNDCEGCTPPTNLAGEYYFEEGSFGTLLTWDCAYDPSKYKIYRSTDGVNYDEIAAIDNTLKEYRDETAVGDYFYKVTAFSTACESTPAFAANGADYVKVAVTAVGEHSASTSIYPNPVDNLLAVEGESMTELAVYDLLGQLMLEEHCPNGTSRMTLSVADLKSGMYMIRIRCEQGVTTHSFIKK